MGATEIRGERWEESLLLVSWGAAHQAPGCQHRTGHGPAPDAATFHEEVWGGGGEGLLPGRGADQQSQLAFQPEPKTQSWKLGLWRSEREVSGC